MAFEGRHEGVARILLMNGARVGSGLGKFGFTYKEWTLRQGRQGTNMNHLVGRAELFFDRLLEWMGSASGRAESLHHRCPFPGRCIIENCDFYGNPGDGWMCSEHARGSCGSSASEGK